MSQATDGNGAGSTRSTTSTFCTWEIPDKGVKIDLHLSTVEWVDFEMKKALRFPTQGAKVSGLLLGRTESGTSRNIIIEGFTSLPREQEPGLSYRFSASDKPILKVQIDQWQPTLGRNLYAVGYYRSDSGEDFSLDDQDAALAKEYFPGSTSVFLLVKPSLTETSRGAFFLCENGEVKADSKILFPFSRTSLAGGEPSLLWAERQLSTEEDASSPGRSWTEPFDSEPSPSWPLEKSSFAQTFRWPWLLALGLMIAVIAGTAYYVLQRPDGQAAKNVAHKTDSLALKVEIERNQIRIGWDRNSPVISVAKRGNLSIQDGTSTRSLDLDSHLLRTGSLVYSTLAADVTVRLQVDAADRSASESVRAVRAGHPAGLSWPPDSSVSSRSGALTEMRSQKDPPSSADYSTDAAGAREGTKIRTPARPSAGGSDLSGPTLRSSQPSSPHAGKEGRGSASEEGRYSSLALAGDLGEEDAYVGPRPVHRVEPDPSFTLHPFTVPAVQINVRVFIDRSGRVVRAESLSRGNALMEHLSKIAMQAARQWTFLPARRGDQSVPSETMLQFQFVNKSLRRVNATE